SHNPPEYNGIKVFGSAGHKLSDELEDEIETLTRTDEQDPPGRGSVTELGEATERYVKHLVEAAEAPLDGLSVVVDCANGAASEEAPLTLRSLGARVEAIFHQPDGTNINVGCGAMHPEVVADHLQRRGAEAVVAHAGDADRAMFGGGDRAQLDGDP